MMRRILAFLREHLPLGIWLFFAEKARAIQERHAVTVAHRASQRIRPHPRLAVFVSNHPRGREAKLAHGLRTAGWKVVLLHSRPIPFDASRHFDEVRPYHHEWEALALASRYAARVYHVFSAFADETTVAFVRHKPGKVVYDPYDVVDGMINYSIDPSFAPWQRYCATHADGLCCRDLRIQRTRRATRSSRPTKSIFFPEYCWTPPLNTPSRVPGKDEEIHTVVCGNFGIEKDGWGEWGYLHIAERLAADGIHIHLYPSWTWLFQPTSDFEKTFSDYLELANRTPYVHLHRPVSPEDLVPELRQYHVGLSLAQGAILGEPNRLFTANALRLCGSARIVDYLDAGITPLISKELRFQRFLVRDAAIVATPDLLTHPQTFLRHRLTPGLTARLFRVRRACSLENHIPRLISFYNAL